MTPAIVLASHTCGLGVIRALASKGVPVSVVYYSKEDIGYLSRCVWERFLAPHPEDAEEAFVDFLMDLPERYDGAVLMPSDDATLATASRSKARLEERFLVACTEWDITERYVDKKYSYTLAEELGVPVPKTVTPSSLDEVRSFSETAEFPCLVKPSVGHKYFEVFRKKMVIVQDADELLSHYEEASEYGLEMMIQEFIPGDDTSGVNYNSFRHGGESLVEFTAEKVRLSPTNIGVPRVLISKEIPEVAEPGRRMLDAMGISGFACTEFKRDARDGVYKFMEINGRQNLSVLHSMRCGINFPWLTYRQLVADELPSQNGCEQGVYWIDLTKDVLSSIQYRPKERYSIREYLRPYQHPRIYAIFDWRDPKPFLKRCSVICAMAVRALFGRNGA